MAQPDRLEGTSPTAGSNADVPEVEAELVAPPASGSATADEGPSGDGAGPKIAEAETAEVETSPPGRAKARGRWVLRGFAAAAAAGALGGLLFFAAPFVQGERQSLSTSAPETPPSTPLEKPPAAALPTSSLPAPSFEPSMARPVPAPAPAATDAGESEVASLPVMGTGEAAPADPDTATEPDLVTPDSAAEGAADADSEPPVAAATEPDASASLPAGEAEPAPSLTADAAESPLPAGAEAPADLTAAGATGDTLDRLEAAAQAREQAEVAGVPPTDYSTGSDAIRQPAAAESARPDPGEGAAVAAELAALRRTFEDDRTRLAAELDAERRRAEAAAAEAVALRARLETALAAPAPAAREEISERRDGRAGLAVLALSQAIEAGAPFEAELAQVEAIAGEQSRFEPLRPHAPIGAPTLGELKTSFGPATRNALGAEARAAARGPLAPFAAGLSRLVSVRPAGPIEGADAAAVISRAEARVDRDDIAGALAELRALRDPARSAFAEWIAKAEVYVEARAAVSDLTAAFLGQALSGGSR